MTANDWRILNASEEVVVLRNDKNCIIRAIFREPGWATVQKILIDDNLTSHVVCIGLQKSELQAMIGAIKDGK